MTINAPTIGSTIQFTLSGVDTQLNEWYVFREEDTATITGDDPTTITSYEEKYFPLEVTASSTTNFEFDDLPYTSGNLSLFLRDNTGWTRADFDIPNTAKTSGINFPVTLGTSSEKQPTPLADSNDIKGAPKYYSSFQEFLYMPREHMAVNIIANVYDEETNTVKQFVLDRNGVDLGNGTFASIGPADILSLPYPMLKEDVTNVRSYQRFWSLLSESQTIAPTSGVIRYYAPDYEDGVPPLYDNLLATGTPGVTYPVGLSVPSDPAFDDQRAFLGTWSYDAPSAQFVNTNTQQVTKTQKPGDKWLIESVDGISFSRWRRIGQFEAGAVTQNRYIRRVTDVDDPYGTLAGGGNKFPKTPQTFLEGKRNRFGRYLDDFLQGGTPVEFQYEDVPPPKRVVQGALSVEESAMYDDFVADGVTNIDIDGLWEVTCIKDKYNRLESDFQTARYIPTNGDLVRYSASSTPNINDLLPADYVANGWVTEFDPDVHRYKAERASTGEDFAIVLIAAEIGTYVSRVFKAYPLRYLDVLTNAATAPNYAPTGIGAGINANDNVDGTFPDAPNGGRWVDSIFQPPTGWALYVSEGVFFFGGDKLKNNWSNPALFDTEAAVVDSITGQEDFKSTPVVDDQGNSSVTYDPLTIDLRANLTLFSQRETDQGQQYILNDDADEDIKYKWERIFNNGAADSTIIFDNTSTADSSELLGAGDLVGGAATYSPGAVDTYRIEGSGRTCKIYPAGLDKRAVYKVTQERTTAGGTVSYIEETRGLLDIADGLASKTVVATADRPYFVLLGDAVATGNVWQFDDYINPKDGTDHPEIILRAFAQNVASGNWYRWSSADDFDSTRETVISGSTTRENTTSGTYWTQLGSADTHVVAADAAEWNDDTINKAVVYKYQSGAYYDIVRVERIQEGADIKDLDLRSNSLVISYNGAEDDYSPASQVVEIRAVAQNLTTAGINWEVVDATGADVTGTVTLYDAATGGSAITYAGETVAYLRTADYPVGVPFNDFKALLPITVRVTHDDDPDQIDFITIREIANGAEGPAGTDALVAFLDNEAETQACNEAGVPIDALFNNINGSLTIRTNLTAFEGLSDVTTSYKFGGATPTNDITAVDEDGNVLTKGVDYDYVLTNNNRTFTVTQMPVNANRLVVTLPIYSTGNVFQLNRKFTVSKSLAGFTSLRFVVDNEFIAGKHQTDNTLLDTSPSGLAGYVVLGSFKAEGYIGADLDTPVFAGLSTDSIVGYEASTVEAFATTWATPGSLGETTARSIRYTDGGNDMYFVQGDSGTVYIIAAEGVVGNDFEYTFGYQKTGYTIASRKIKFKWFELPNDIYQVQVYADNPTFSATDGTGAQRVISARIIDKNGTAQTSLPAGWSLVFSVNNNNTVTTEPGYAKSISISKSDVNSVLFITVELRDAFDGVVSVGGITIYDLKDAAAFEQAVFSTDTPGTPSQNKPSGLFNDLPDTADDIWAKGQATVKKYLWVSRKSQYAGPNDWPVGIMVKGEEGEQGGLTAPIRIYKVADELPLLPGAPTLPGNAEAFTAFDAPAGWDKTPSYQGASKLWVADSFLEFTGGAWSWVGPWSISLLGSNESYSEAYVYRGATTENPSWVNSYDEPDEEFPQNGASNWKNTIRGITDPYIFRAKGFTSSEGLARRVIPSTITNAGLITVNADEVRPVSSVFQFFKNNVQVTSGVANNVTIFEDRIYRKLSGITNSWVDEGLAKWWDLPELIYTSAEGDAGWSPVFAVVTPGGLTSNRVLQVIDWVGGEGTKPVTGQYVGSAGFVGTPEAAENIRGATGAAGADGSAEFYGNSLGTWSSNVFDGNKAEVPGASGPWLIEVSWVDTSSNGGSYQAYIRAQSSLGLGTTNLVGYTFHSPNTADSYNHSMRFIYTGTLTRFWLYGTSVDNSSMMLNATVTANKITNQ